MMGRGLCLGAIVTSIIATDAMAFVLNDNPRTRRPFGEYTINTQITHSTLGAISPSGISWNLGFQQALDAWNDAPGLGALVDLGANFGIAEDPCEAADDGVHGVAFLSTFCGESWGQQTLAIAVRSFRNGGLVTDGNIVFRDDGFADWDIVSGNQGGADDFRRVAVHEIGHLLGLDHPPGNAAIMFASIQNGIEVPQNDDILGVQALYDLGCPQLNPGVGTLNGSLDATDCFDSEIGLPLPAANACASLASFEEDALVDLYRVVLPPATSLDITMSSNEFNPTIQVLNTALDTELFCDWDSIGGTASLSVSPGAGTYVVAARSVFRGSGSAYNLVLVPEVGGLSLGLTVLGSLGVLRRRRDTA